ncbi:MULTISPECIES: hypothetical protein [Pseudomonas]|uniref:hypothetical protein n=1 Tax=Pseudomonas TaxID=286 RepID=UPI00059B597F|nr:MULTISPECIES: hypothetical protein [Pseudomonas]AMT89236.1 hypothetical protein AYO71_17485 [Pseudomonas koreensis]MBB4054276.1 hypothetical protein [Pseudomonas koreensis]TSB53260.1 hypothetical protein FEE99_05735 [Pseudomonas sp. ef1]
MEQNTSAAPNTESAPAKPVVADETCAKPPRDIGEQPEAPEDTPGDHDKVKTPCSTIYGSAIYDTENESFWLLPERTNSALKEASSDLEQKVSSSKSPEERKKGLYESGLLEYFLEPKLANFLEGDEKARMLEIEAQHPNISNLDAALLDAQQNLKTTAPEDSSTQLTALEQDQLKRNHFMSARDAATRVRGMHSEWQKLKRMAIAAAKEKGYAYESGNLYAPKAIAAREAVQKYLKAREALLEDKDLTTLTSAELAPMLAQDKKRIDEIAMCGTNNQLMLCTYVRDQEIKRKERKATYSAYLEAITDVAQYGIALPEFALISEGGAVESGVDLFKQYMALEKEQKETNERLSAKYKGWIEASGRQAKAPTNLVTNERADWDRLQASKEKLRLQAESNVETAIVRRHLLWEPEQFQARPEERLIKNGFPLAEMSMADSLKKPLTYLSMYSLPRLKQTVKDDWKKVGAKVKDLMKRPGNSDGKATTDTELSLFGQWLKSEGALRIKDQESDWFSAEGWFEIEKFNAYLENKKYKVTALENAGTRKEWGDRLQQVLFKDNVRKTFRIFDITPQAQLVRCLMPSTTETIHSSTKVEGPDWTLAEGFQASAKATFAVDLARGEVELFKVDLPDRASAKDIVITYRNAEDMQQKMNLGRFSLYLGAKAWGYAGASLLLSSEIALDVSNAGFHLAPPEPVVRNPDKRSYARTEKSGQIKKAPETLQIQDGAKAAFNLFAGLQTGIMVTGALNWAPPGEVALLTKAPVSGKAAGMKASEWFSLARLTVELNAAAGLGARAEASISLHEGRLILVLKAALIAGPGVGGSFKFEVGYDAVTELLNMFRRELYKNKQNPYFVIEDETYAYLSKLNTLAIGGFDIRMIYLMGADAVMTLYESLTATGKGGSIADTIMFYDPVEELEEWCINAIPGALGPLLMTLISPPDDFSVNYSNNSDKPDKKERKYDSDQAHLVQQQAIERILGWIVKSATKQNSIEQAQYQFEQICMCMNKFGMKPANADEKYCENRLALDNFMTEAVLRLTVPSGEEMRTRYKDHVKLLGAKRDGSCQRSQYQGRTYVPAGVAKFIPTIH